MSSDNDTQVREALLALHRQLQENVAQLGSIDCEDSGARAMIDAINALNELAATLVVEASLLVPLSAL